MSRSSITTQLERLLDLTNLSVTVATPRHTVTAAEHRRGVRVATNAIRSAHCMRCKFSESSCCNEGGLRRAGRVGFLQRE